MSSDTNSANEVDAPMYDLAALSEKHCQYELDARNIDATMIFESYVNHIPTMTCGSGTKKVSRFYKYHFINSNPKDTQMIPISCVVGNGSSSRRDVILFYT